MYNISRTIINSSFTAFFFPLIIVGTELFYIYTWFYSTHMEIYCMVLQHCTITQKDYLFIQQTKEKTEDSVAFGVP